MLKKHLFLSHHLGTARLGAAALLLGLLNQRLKLVFLRENLDKIKQKWRVIVLPLYILRFPPLHLLLLHHQLLRHARNLILRLFNLFSYCITGRVPL